MDKAQASRSIALVANGDISNYTLIKPLIEAHDRVIAVDGGLVHCHNMDIVPDCIVGDFDSTPKELLELYSHIPHEKFPREKDYSDLELAIAAANPAAVEKIVLYGAMGKRMDHALYNIQLMCRYPSKVFIETEFESLMGLEGTQRIKTVKGQTVSLIPVATGPVTVTTKGLKWELSHAVLSHHLMSLSNIALGDSIEVHVEKGVLVLVLGSGLIV
jgi:thiamine pyrophosphokinase